MRNKLILRGTGELLDQIPLHLIHSNPATSVTHNDLTTLTSYSLLEKRHRAIIVPGTPSLWSPPPLLVRITPDSSRSICNAAGHVFPTCPPLEPLLRTLLTTRPDYNLRATDLITDLRNLRLLYKFAAGEKSDFCINAEVTGNTVLFSRWMKSAVTYMRGFDGYGHSFESTFTKVPKAVRGSISHNRVMAYELSGVRIVMRFEVDAYVGSGRAPGPNTFTGPSHAELRRTNVQPPTGLTAQIGGQYIDPARIVEIKTPAAGKSLRARAKIQVWLSQTSYLYRGSYREGGVFDEVKEVKMLEDGKMHEWAEANKEKLRRLVRVIEMVREAVRRRRGKCVIVHQRDQVLKIYSLVDPNSRGLPPDLLEKWKE